MQKLSLVVVCALSSACGLFDGGGDDTSPIIDGDWPVDRPMAKPIAPGQSIVLHVTGVDVPASDLFVWAYDDAVTMPPAIIDDGEVPDDGDLTITLYAPFFRTGEQVFYLGDGEGHRSGAIAVDVVVPTPRLSRSDAARLLTTGLDMTIGQVEELLADPDPEWQAMWGSTYDATERGSIDAVFTELHQLRPKIEQVYNELSDEDEAAFQSYLEQRGILRDFEAGLDGIAGSTARVRPDAAVTIYDRTPHVLSRVLYTLDMSSTVLSMFSDALTVVGVVSVVVPGLQPIAAASWALEFVPIAIRLVIDNLIPTDLYNVSEEMVQREMFRGVGANSFYWGMFATETQSIADFSGSFDDLVANLASQAFGKRATVAARVIQEIAATMAAKLGLDGLARLFGETPSAKGPTVRIAAIVNMQLYSVTLSDLFLLTPVTAMYKTWLYVIPDPELRDPFTSRPLDGSLYAEYAKKVDIYMTYSADTLYFQNVAWPLMAPNERALVLVGAFSYRFTTTSFPYVVSFPWIDRVPVHEPLIKLRYGADPGDPSSSTEDHALLITNFPGTAGYREWFDSKAPRTMQVPITVNDLAGGRFDTATVSIAVNGQVVIPNLPLVSGGTVGATITLNRGTNTITVTGTQGHVTPYNASGFNSSVPVKVGIPDVALTDKDRGLYLNVGESGTITVITPPNELDLEEPE